MKNKHRIKQGLSLLLAGGIALTNLGAALPAFAVEDVGHPLPNANQARCTVQRAFSFATKGEPV